MKPEPLIVCDPDVLGGTPVFNGTRVPVTILFSNILDGLSLDEILFSYPTLSREQASEALMMAARYLERDAVPIAPGTP